MNSVQSSLAVDLRASQQDRFIAVRNMALLTEMPAMQAIIQMDTVTQQNAALVEQATAAAQSMADQAQSLRDAVARFVVADDGAGSAQPNAPRRPAQARRVAPALGTSR